MKSKCSKSILYVWQSHFPWEVRAEKICRALAQDGHKVTLFAKASNEQNSTQTNSRTIPYDGFQIWPWHHPFSAAVPGNLFWTKALLEAARATHADLIMARDILIAPMALKAARTLNIPMVIDMAEHYPAAMRGWKKYNRSFLSRLMIHDLKLPDRVEKTVALKADGILTVCQEQSERLIKMGVKVENLQVVHNTPELEIFNHVRKGPHKPIRVIAHHGHMTPERGLGTLLEAFALIAADFPDLHLHLAGAGETAVEIEKQVRALKIEKRVRITGAYAFKDLPNLISEMDVGILPYPQNDLIDHTLSNKIFDYMACAKPVLVSDTKPMRRLVNETGAGFILNCQTPASLAQSLRDFLAQDPLPFSQNGLRAAQTYNWQVDQTNLNRFLEKIWTVHS